MSITVLNRCTYFLEKKKRKCRLLAKEGAKFCGEHSLFNETDTNVCLHYLSVNIIICLFFRIEYHVPTTQNIRSLLMH